MDVITQGAERFLNGVDPDNKKSLSVDRVVASLQELMTDSGGKLDLKGIISNLDAQGLMGIADSWLGNGENTPISANAVKNLFGGEKLSQIATKLDLDEDSVANGVTRALPEIIDKSSRDGSLLDMADDLLGSFKKFF
jgi:uncharacterized protein YidB (DUF937 family)